MTVRIFEHSDTVQIIVPKVKVLEFNLSYPDSQLRMEEHWFIFDPTGRLEHASTESREADLLALAAYSWRVRQIQKEIPVG